MKRAEALTVVAGDVVNVNPLFNSTTAGHARIVSDAVVQAVRYARGSQTGVMFRVSQIDNQPVWLDASWFISKIGRQGNLL